MSNIINSEAYVKQGDKVYKVNGGSPIHTFNSVDEMNAANLADGTIACVPSEGDEVVDFSGVFDFATSIAAGGAEQSVQYEVAPLIAERFKKGTAKVIIKINGIIAEAFVNATLVGSGQSEVVSVVTFAELNGSVLYLQVRMIGTTITYKCMSVPTQPYVPS